MITKNGVSVIPHQNWRGMFTLGTNPAGGRDVPDIDWPGFHTTPWHGPTRVVENWFGSLSTEMRDATGQLYKRNRYYDPASGQFTQPDPIGLAGGLNSYGFAEGDPVSYSDPYGLCPEELERADGSCPGGMSHAEYNRLENLIIMKIAAAAGDPLLQMLENGRLVANEPMEGSESRVQTVHYPDLTPSYLRIGPDFWSEGSDAAAFTLTHDYGHVLQKERRGLIYGNDPPLSLNDWNAVTRSRGFGPGGLLQSFFNATQDDANKYACANTVASSDYHTRFCR